RRPRLGRQNRQLGRRGHGRARRQSPCLPRNLTPYISEPAPFPVQTVLASMSDTADYRLLGPPEARHAAMITAAARTDEASSGPKDCSVKRESDALGPAGKTRTKKRSPTFPSSGDPCLDFFFRVLPATPAATVARLLAAAWAADPSTALRLVANLRGVRGSGKSDRESFYAAALWLHARAHRRLRLPQGSPRAAPPDRARRPLQQSRKEDGSPCHRPPRPLWPRALPRLTRAHPQLPQAQATPQGGPCCARRHGGGAPRGKAAPRPGALGCGGGVAPEQEGGYRCDGDSALPTRPHVPAPARPHGQSVCQPPRGGHAQARQRRRPGTLTRGEVVPVTRLVVRPLHSPLRGRSATPLPQRLVAGADR
uniref:DUF2828 domain-containing protein n=2 Tax=Aegilops tauschii subsp. strangulata TaxID=200361 RepID=A0A453NHX7_AEGTS